MRRKRTALRIIAWVSSSLAVLALLLIGSLTLWLQTAGGRDWVAGMLMRAASERLAITLSVGRISGNMIRGIHLERVTLHDTQGRLLARADELSAHYRLLRLIRHREVERIAIVRPDIVRLPILPSSASSTSEPTTLSVPILTIVDGSFHGIGVDDLTATTAIELGRAGARSLRIDGDASLIVRGHALSVQASVERDGARAQVVAALRGAGFEARGRGAWADGKLTAKLEALDVGALHAQGTLVGPLDALELALQGRTGDRRATLHTRVALDGRAIDLRAIVVSLGATTLTGTARLEPGARELDAKLALRVAPTQAALLGIHPAGPIRLKLRLHGPLRALDVRVDGRLRTGRVALAGRVDLPARRGQVRFVAHDVHPSDIEPKAPPMAFSGTFVFDGAVLANGTLTGRLSVTDGSYSVAGLDFDRLRGTSLIRIAQPGEASVEALSGQLAGKHPRPVEVRTVVRWDHQALRFDTPSAVLDGNEAMGEVVFTHDAVTRKAHVTVHAQKLVVSPALIHAILRRPPSRAWPGEATLVWTRDEDYRLTFTLDTDHGPAKGELQMRKREDGVLELPRIAVDWGGSRARGAARFVDGEIVASVEELLLQPRLVHALYPALDPIRALRIEGAVAGPREALELKLVATAGPSTIMVRGQVDLRARTFSLLGAVDTLESAQLKKSKTGRITLELALIGRVEEQGLVGTLTVRHATGTFQGLPITRAILDAHLDGAKFKLDQILAEVPGAVVEAKGGGSYSDFRIGYSVLITDALALKSVPPTLRLLVGLAYLFPGYAVEGSVQRKDGGKIQEKHKTIPPGTRLLNLLWHLAKGDRIHFTVP